MGLCGSLASSLIPLKVATNDDQPFCQFAEFSNLLTHLNLRSLRQEGSRKRAIPYGYGFNWVSFPNYFFEILAWVFFTVMTGSWASKEPFAPPQSTRMLREYPTRCFIPRCRLGYDGELGRAETWKVQEGVWE
jgi:hypothetical protein